MGGDVVSPAAPGQGRGRRARLPAPDQKPGPWTITAAALGAAGLIGVLMVSLWSFALLIGSDVAAVLAGIALLALFIVGYRWRAPILNRVDDLLR